MRLFIASGFSAPFVERVKEIQNSAASLLERRVKWVEPENIHLTYAFLGDVPAERSGAVTRSLEAASRLFKKQEVALGGLGAFPSLAKPRVLWLGLQEKTAGMLEALALKIYESLLDGGFMLERRFSAHVTIGRVRDGLNLSALAGVSRICAGLSEALRPRPQEVRSPLVSVELMESLLSPSGARYRIIASCALSSEPADD